MSKLVAIENQKLKLFKIIIKIKTIKKKWKLIKISTLITFFVNAEKNR